MTTLDVLFRQSQTLSAKLHAMAVEKRVGRTLRGTTPEATDEVDFVVFFADGPGQSYQLEQWTASFEALQDQGYSVCLIMMNALSARVLAQRTRLPILLSRSMERIESALESWGTYGIFYVNNSQANFTMLRVNGPAHVHLSHGESEKSSMVSNQLKAYDFAFIAGQAARTRILANIPRFDPAKLVEIGRPQLDVETADAAATHGDLRSRILYAPTWEGDGKSMSYTSITSVGTKLIEALLADNRFTVVFRPHPKTGSWSLAARQERARIEKAIVAAASTFPDAGHRIDKSADSSRSILDADIVVCDISAMAMDTIGLDRPLLLLHSTGTGMLDELAPEQLLSLEQAGAALLVEHGQDLLNTIARLSEAGPSDSQRSVRNNVFGDPALGRPTDRFISAASALTDLRGRP